MSHRFRCNTCGGEYLGVQSDGLRYFHVCPPIPDPLFVPDPRQGKDQDVPLVERPNKRDENWAFEAKRQPGKEKAKGAGRTQLGE